MDQEKLVVENKLEGAHKRCAQTYMNTEVYEYKGRDGSLLKRDGRS